MKDIKKNIKRCFEILLFAFILLCSLIMAAGIYFYFYFGDKCLDVGGVWDPDRHECRYDCDKWIDGKGCVVFDKTQAK